MVTPTIPLLFLDGIVSITAMCFYFLLPVICILVALFSWEKISQRDESLLRKTLFVGGITIVLLDGVYLVYLMLSFPHAGLTQLYLEYRKETGIFLGILLFLLYGYRLVNIQNEKLFSFRVSLFAAGITGLVITATWAPCIRESVASISTQEEGRFIYFLSYIAGLTFPFLLLSASSFGLKFLLVTQENMRRLSSIGIILLILLSLSKTLIG